MAATHIQHIRSKLRLVCAELRFVCQLFNRWNSYESHALLREGACASILFDVDNSKHQSNIIMVVCSLNIIQSIYDVHVRTYMYVYVNNYSLINIML